MKAVVAFILLGLCLLIQFCLLTAWGDSLAIPNVTLALLVMLSFYVDVEQMMWLGFIGGLFTDLYSQTEFGYYLGLYILVVLISKVVFRFGQGNKSWWLASLVIVGASIIQMIVLNLSLISSRFSVSYWVLFEQALWSVVWTVLCGLGIFVLLQFASQSMAKYFQPKGSV